MTCCAVKFKFNKGVLMKLLHDSNYAEVSQLRIIDSMSAVVVYLVSSRKGRMRCVESLTACTSLRSSASWLCIRDICNSARISVTDTFTGRGLSSTVLHAHSARFELKGHSQRNRRPETTATAQKQTSYHEKKHTMKTCDHTVALPTYTHA